MELLSALKSCDVFDIQINWKGESKGCVRYSEYLTDGNIEYANEDDDIPYGAEFIWGDSEHDAHSVYLSIEALKEARVEHGFCIVDGYTECGMPELSQPMRFRLFSTRPFKQSA